MLSYKNQRRDLYCISIEWFLYDRNLAFNGLIKQAWSHNEESCRIVFDHNSQFKRLYQFCSAWFILDSKNLKYIYFLYLCISLVMTLMVSLRILTFVNILRSCLPWSGKLFTMYVRMFWLKGKIVGTGFLESL